MRNNKKTNISINKYGGLVLPEELREQSNLIPGTNAEMNLSENCIETPPTINKLKRVYIEPTNVCNLECRTCMRNIWQEQNGFMSMETYEKIIESIRWINPIPLFFFGGIGEPLAHPNIREMVTLAKNIGAEVELITNGILLDEAVSIWMIELGLDRLWVSIDGAKPESYADIRLGDALPKVISNLEQLKKLKVNPITIPTGNPKLGIAFVAMQRNFKDLPDVVGLGKKLGADLFSISNVLPYTEELRSQMLYSRSLYISYPHSIENSSIINLPRFDLNEPTLRIVSETFTKNNISRLNNKTVDNSANLCPFVNKSSISVRWDGNVSPCLSLLHSHTSYLDDTFRTTKEFFVGSVNAKPLLDIWNDLEYVELRERLMTFDFSPCTMCNSCEMAESNLEDCFGNVHPTCGGCLWTQGFIKCP